MYRLKRLKISAVISIISLGILQCLQPRASYVDSRKVEQESHLNLLKGQTNNYSEKTRGFLKNIKYWEKIKDNAPNCKKK